MKTVTYYVADDGEKFSTRKDCEEYEASLRPAFDSKDFSFDFLIKMIPLLYEAFYDSGSYYRDFPSRDERQQVCEKLRAYLLELEKHIEDWSEPVFFEKYSSDLYKEFCESEKYEAMVYSD